MTHNVSYIRNPKCTRCLENGMAPVDRFSIFLLAVNYKRGDAKKKEIDILLDTVTNFGLFVFKDFK